MTAALRKEAAEIADNVLLEFSENSDVRAEDQRIYRLMAQSANAPLDEDLNGGTEPRPQLQVIQGCNSAA